jgi:hypothetical protein
MEKQANYLQDRANQAAATDMFVNWDKEASAVTTWYKSQSGKNAVDALPEYYKKLDEVREKFVGQSPISKSGGCSIRTRSGAWDI